MTMVICLKESNMKPVLPLLLALAAPLAAQVAPPAGAGLMQKYHQMRGRIAEAGKAVGERRLDDARDILTACLKDMPEHPVAHYMLAKMDYEATDYAKALVHMEAAERGLALLDLAYTDEQEFQRARDGLEVSEIQTKGNRITSGVGGYNGCGGPIFTDKENRLHYLEAKQNWSGDTGGPFQVPASYHLLHANCLGILGRDPEAIQHYRSAVNEDPALATAWHNLIFLLVKTKDPAGALEALRRADAAKVQIDPALRKAVEAVPDPIR